jgi:hypothetical protein
LIDDAVLEGGGLSCSLAQSPGGGGRGREGLALLLAGIFVVVRRARRRSERAA